MKIKFFSPKMLTSPLTASALYTKQTLTNNHIPVEQPPLHKPQASNFYCGSVDHNKTSSVHIILYIKA